MPEYGVNIDWETKVKLFNEWLRNGGTETIQSVDLLEDILKVKFINGKVIPETVSTRVNAAMLAIVGSQLMAPYYSDKHISEYQTLLQKSIFFDQVNIETEEEFDAIFEEHKDKENHLYRGVSEAKWRLYSSIQRHWLQSKLYETEADYLQLLERIVANGREAHSEEISQLIKEKNGDSENDIAILSYLQHHGCPTPLMDWSFKFCNALYFALDGIQPNSGTREVENYFSLYHIEEEHLKSSSIKLWIDQSLANVEAEKFKEEIAKVANNRSKRRAMEARFKRRKLFDRQKVKGAGMVAHMVKMKRLINISIGYFSDRDEADGLYFSLDNSKNILNQEGVFTWNADPSKPLEQMGNEQIQEEEGEDTNYRFSQCYNIHKHLEKHVRARIEKEGVTKDFIYPEQTDTAWKTFEKSLTKES